MHKFTVTARRRRQVEKVLILEDQVEAVQIDYSAWAEENAAVTGITWTTEWGQATVAGSSLSSNVESARISATEPGRSLLKVVAATGSSYQHVLHIEVTAKAPPGTLTTDYT